MSYWIIKISLKTWLNYKTFHAIIEFKQKDAQSRILVQTLISEPWHKMVLIKTLTKFCPIQYLVNQWKKRIAENNEKVICIVTSKKRENKHAPSMYFKEHKFILKYL